MKVAILGNGLSAAFAHRACIDSGVLPITFSKSSKNIIPKGAIWFHWLPFKSNPIKVGIIGTGKSERYVYKQWGRQDIRSSFPEKVMIKYVYDIEENLKKLWEGLSLQIADLNSQDILEISKEFDLVVQTFPLKETYKVMGKYLVEFPITVQPPQLFNKTPFEYDLQIYNFKAIHNLQIACFYGGGAEKWVRKTLNRQGEMCTEYPYKDCQLFERDNPKVHFARDLRPETKPYLDVLANNIILEGRYARWDRKYLSHQTYSKIFSLLKKRLT